MTSHQDLVPKSLDTNEHVCQWTSPTGLIFYHLFASFAYMNVPFTCPSCYNYPTKSVLPKYVIYISSITWVMRGFYTLTQLQFSLTYVIWWFFIQVLPWNQTPISKCEPTCCAFAVTKLPGPCLTSLSKQNAFILRAVQYTCQFM